MHVLVAASAAGGVGVAVSSGVAFVRHRRTSRRLELLYRLTRQLGGSCLASDVTTLLVALRRVLRAGRVEITLLEGEQWRRTTLVGVQARPRAQEGRGTPGEWGAVPSGATRVEALTVDASTGRSLRHRLGEGAVLAPVRTGATTVGLVGVGRPFGRRSFGAEDLRLLEVLARQFAVTVENYRLAGRLEHDATHDQLTGLANRVHFTELLVGLPVPSAVLLIDLDRFKDVNDTLGHPQGDRLLVQAAARLVAEVGRRGVVARLGGDEFGVLLARTTAAEAARVAAAVLACLQEPFVIGGVCLEVTASIGLTARGEGRADPDRLLAEAEVAMYAAKASQRGWERYAPHRDPHSRERLSLAAELRRAIERGELELHYQPKVDLRDGRVCGLEALVRWRHPERGLLGPDDFIPAAENAGLIRRLTLWVLDAAIAQQRELRRAGHDLEIAVNLSLRSMVDLDFPDRVAHVLHRHDVSPRALTLEITESSVMADPNRTIGILSRLAALGTTISVDDFGTGYSSLSHLKRLPAGELKIDRSFVAGMLDAPRDGAIVASTIDLAQNLGLRAVAEGVEDPATWSALAALGCDCAQGFYVSRPMPADRLRRWLNGGRGLRPVTAARPGGAPSPPLRSPAAGAPSSRH